LVLSRGSGEGGFLFVLFGQLYLQKTTLAIHCSVVHTTIQSRHRLLEYRHLIRVELRDSVKGTKVDRKSVLGLAVLGRLALMLLEQGSVKNLAQ
jgi:hypothetical protein